MPQETLIQNLTGGWNVSDIRIANLSDTINMFVETQGSGSSTTSLLRSIYGTEVLKKISDKPCKGIFECSRGNQPDGRPLLFAVFGNELHAVYYSEGEWKNELLYTGLTNEYYNTPVSMCETGGEGSAHPHLIVVDGQHVIAVDTTLEFDDMKVDCRPVNLPYRVVQEDPKHPTQVIRPTHCAYCYNYLIVNDADTDAFYITYQYPFERTGRTASETVDRDIFMVNPWKESEMGYKDYGFITYAEWSPDNITAIKSNGTLLYTFGPKSTQIFTYNSDIDAPFVSPTNCANGIGIKAVNSAACVSDYLFFLGSSSIGENGIYQWKGNQLSKISTPDVERYISNMDNEKNIDVSDAIGQCWMEDGHLFYGISFISGDYTLVYDMTENLWHRRSTKDQFTNAQHYWRFNFATLHQNKLIFGTDDGYLVYLKSDKFTEYDGRPMIRIRRSGMMMTDYKDYIVDSIKLICNNGDHTDITLSPKIMLRYCDNGGEWSNQELGLLGKQGQYNFETEFYNLGLHNIMSIEVSVSDPVNFAILGGKIRYSVIDS